MALESLSAALRNPNRDSIPRTTPDPTEIPEVILNLWYLFDATGFCYALRAKAYVAAGTDEEKLALLHTLAPHDWRIAPLLPIPENFHVRAPDGTVAEAFFLAFKDGIGGMISLFEPAIQEIEAEFPADCRLTIPGDPLTCITPLYLHDDGRIEPHLSPPGR